MIDMKNMDTVTVFYDVLHSLARIRGGDSSIELFRCVYQHPITGNPQLGYAVVGDSDRGPRLLALYDDNVPVVGSELTLFPLTYTLVPVGKLEGIRPEHHFLVRRFIRDLQQEWRLG